MDNFGSSLQVDYRQLITDTKRSEGLSSQITGFFSGPENPAVKEAAERAILKVRSFSGPNVIQRIRESQVGRAEVYTGCLGGGPLAPTASFLPLLPAVIRDCCCPHALTGCAHVFRPAPPRTLCAPSSSHARAKPPSWSSPPWGRFRSCLPTTPLRPSGWRAS